MTRVLLAATCLAVALVALAGCASPDALYATETALTAAESAATLYVRLPLCPQPGGLLCSDAGVSAKIKRADSAAYGLVLQMRAGKATPAEAAAAIAALVTLIPVRAR